jgi:hypothetical protein
MSQAINAVEALGIDPADVAPEHWRPQPSPVVEQPRP